MSKVSTTGSDPVYRPGMGRSSLLIRTGLTQEEWQEIRRQASAQDISAKKLITDTLRKGLLKHFVREAA
jgi:hypothetical protein